MVINQILSDVGLTPKDLRDSALTYSTKYQREDKEPVEVNPGEHKWVHTFLIVMAGTSPGKHEKENSAPSLVGVKNSFK